MMDIVTGCHREASSDFRADPQIRGAARRAVSRMPTTRRRRIHAERAVITFLMGAPLSVVPPTTWTPSDSRVYGIVLTALITPAPVGEITPTPPQIPAPALKPIAPPPPQVEPPPPPRQQQKPAPQQEVPPPPPEAPPAPQQQAPAPQEAPPPPEAPPAPAAPAPPETPAPPPETPPSPPPGRGHVRLAP